LDLFEQEGQVAYQNLFEYFRSSASDKRIATVTCAFQFINQHQNSIRIDDLLTKFKPLVLF